MGKIPADIIVSKFVQNDMYNKRLCNTLAELIKLEYDNVQRESSMTEEEIRENRAAINEEIRPGRGYSRFTLRVMRQGCCYTEKELTQSNLRYPEEFASYVHNHGYYTIADEVRARVTEPYERMKHTASAKEKIDFIRKSYAEFNKMRDIIEVLYYKVDIYNENTLNITGRNWYYHIPLSYRIVHIFYEQVSKNIEEDMFAMIIEPVILHYYNDSPSSATIIKDAYDTYQTIVYPNFDSKYNDEYKERLEGDLNRELESALIKYHMLYYRKKATTMVKMYGYDGYVEWFNTVCAAMKNLPDDNQILWDITHNMRRIPICAIVKPHYNNMIFDSVHGVFNMMAHNNVVGIRQLYQCLSKLLTDDYEIYTVRYVYKCNYDGSIEKMCKEMCRFIKKELMSTISQFEKRTCDHMTNDGVTVTIDTIISDVDSKYSEIAKLCINDDPLFHQYKSAMFADYRASIA